MFNIKKISRNFGIKIFAFIIILICCFTFVMRIIDVAFAQIKYFESLFQKDYLKSESLSDNYKAHIESVINMFDLYVSKDMDTYNRLYNNMKEKNEMEFFFSSGTCNIKNLNEDFKLELENLENIKNMDFEKELNKIRKNTTYFIFDNNHYSCEPENVYMERVAREIADELSMSGKYTNENYRAYISLTDEYIQSISEEWGKERTILLNETIGLVTLLIIALAAYIYLVISAGKNGNSDMIVLNTFDKLYTDVNIALTVFSAIFMICALELICRDLIRGQNTYFVNVVIAFIITIFVGIFLILNVSVIKHLKNGTFLKHSLIYTIINKILNFFRLCFRKTGNILNGGPIMFKALGLIGLFGILCIFSTIIFPPILIALAVATVCYISDNINKFKQIKQCLGRMSQGELGVKINIKGSGELAKLSQNINAVAEGMEKAVQNEVKSERMKSELISNVSHDIKTPLTSIINYVDLLKREGLESENANKYLEILDQKSQRLKILVEDLFEAAKASSGDMPVNLEKIEIYSLIRQGIAELEDKIEKSGFHFVVDVSDEKVYVLADGKLLWRVIENLLSNVFKYAMPNSRVYIDVTVFSEKACIIIKNISAYELNISADELMERFKRADASRNSEGSGLGLAIAKNLMELQKGNLLIEIDGDLFKATITIPRFKE